MSKTFEYKPFKKNIISSEAPGTFECACCGGIFPNSKKKYLGRDDICEKCFWTIRRVERW